MGLFDRLKGKKPNHSQRSLPVEGGIPFNPDNIPPFLRPAAKGVNPFKTHNEVPVDVALSVDMQIYTPDELARALSYKIADRVQDLVERAQRDIGALPKVTYVPIAFPNEEMAYAVALPTLASMEDALRQASVRIGGNGAKARSGIPSVDAIDSLIEKYSAEFESVMPGAKINPLNEVSIRVRAAIVGYMESQIMPVLQRPQIPGYEVLGKKQLEQRIAGMQPYQPGTK